MEYLLPVVVALVTPLYVVVGFLFFQKPEKTWKRAFNSLEADFEELQERVNYSLGRISRLRGLQKRATPDNAGEPEQPGQGTSVSVPAPALAGLPNRRKALYAAHLLRRKTNAVAHRASDGQSR